MTSSPFPSAECSSGSELRWRTWWSIVALPALMLAALMAIYSVELPSYDQWIGISPLLEKLGDGTLRLNDLLVLHNEHRIVIPRLIFLPLAVLTHWNTRVEMYLVWLTLGGIAANWWCLLRATGWKASPGTHGLFAVMALLVFHTLQFENVLSGFQFHFVLPIFLFSAGLWVAQVAPAPQNFIAAMALATAATFSSAQGLLCWPLLAPVLWLRERRVRWWLAYAVGASVNVALYFRGYVSLEKHPAPHDLGQAIGYGLSYLGAPFADGLLLSIVAQAQWCGAVMVCLFLTAFVALLRRRSDAAFVGRALPWLMVASLAIGTAVLTATGRAGFGAEQAFETRYTTYSILLPIALIPLGALLLCSNSPRVEMRESRGLRRALYGAAACLLLSHVVAQAVRLPVWANHRQQRLMSRAILQTIQIGAGATWGRFVSPDPSRLGESVASLKRLGYLHMTPLETAAISAVGNPHSRGDARFGCLTQSGATDGAEIGGWAALPDRGEAADAVLLTYDDPDGQPTIFGMTIARLDCRQAVAATGNPELATSGWRVDLRASALPDGARIVKAWAYDAASGRAWRLAGQTAIER